MNEQKRRCYKKKNDKLLQVRVGAHTRDIGSFKPLYRTCKTRARADTSAGEQRAAIRDAEG